ncbi:unnamed protein product, partial [Iphiclides podalirius]
MADTCAADARASLRQRRNDTRLLTDANTIEVCYFSISLRAGKWARAASETRKPACSGLHATLNFCPVNGGEKKQHYHTQARIGQPSAGQGEREHCARTCFRRL